jgi:hypothetical protein
MNEKLQILRDQVKRRFIDSAQGSRRLQTPMTNLVGMLKAYGVFPQAPNALELFGMHGLWHTRDYVEHCSTIEFYELNPVYASFAARTLPNSNVVVADSIDAVNSGKLKRAKYDLIVSDNPYLGIYGNGYAEHFDIFPRVLNYIDNGLLIVNFIPVDPGFKKEQAARREQFYGKVLPSIDEAAAVYKKLIEKAGLRNDRYFYTFRHSGVGYLTFTCNK